MGFPSNTRAELTKWETKAGGLLTRTLTTGLDDHGRAWNGETAKKAAEMGSRSGVDPVDGPRLTRNAPLVRGLLRLTFSEDFTASVGRLSCMRAHVRVIGCCSNNVEGGAGLCLVLIAVVRDCRAQAMEDVGLGLTSLIMPDACPNCGIKWSIPRSDGCCHVH